MKKSTLAIYGLLMVVGVGLIYFLTVQVIPRALVSLTKAAPSQRVSFTNSLILGERVLVAADGTEKVKVNVFVMDDSGRGILGRSVQLLGEVGGLPMTAVTGNEGVASFEFGSKKEGVFEIGASIEGVDLGKKVKVTFRN
jgi:hypothetical protein